MSEAGKVNKHLYLCHPLVLSSPKLMMHGHMNLKFLSTYLKTLWLDRNEA